jgi:hypothetical protein
LLTLESASELDGIARDTVSSTTHDFTCLLETLPVLSRRERLYMEMYLQYVDLRPIDCTASLIRPNYQAVEEDESESSVSRVTAAYDALRERMADIKKQSVPVQRAGQNGLYHPYTCTNMIHTLHQQNVAVPNAVRATLEVINMARRDFFSCVASGDFATACALNDEIDAALIKVKDFVSDLQIDVRAAALAEADKVTVNFSCKVQAAWGSALIQQLLPFSTTYSKIVLSPSLWTDVVDIKAVLMNEPLRNAREVNKLQHICAEKRPASELVSASAKRRRVNEECNEESDIDEDQLALEMEAIAASSDMGIEVAPAPSLTHAWLAAYLYHKELPHESLPPVSTHMRQAIVRGTGAGTGKQVATDAVGASLIVTPSSLSSLLFHN